jgi:CheY-like chemotaxis protein
LSPERISGRPARDDVNFSAAAARALIVDDDAAEARALTLLLIAAGHWDYRVVHTAAAAIPAAVEFLPGIVFLDIELPEMSGYEVALLLRQHAVLQGMRLIALTDDIEHVARERARDSGFERYLVKPVAELELRKVLDKRRPDKRGDQR